MSDDPFIKAGPLTDEEAAFIRRYIQSSQADYVPSEKLHPLIEITPQLKAVAVAMGQPDELRDHRKKLEALLLKERVSVLTGFADLLVNGKRFTIAMGALAAFGGALAMLMKFFPLVGG